jgi:hypothetical protein
MDETIMYNMYITTYVPAASSALETSNMTNMRGKWIKRFRFTT